VVLIVLVSASVVVRFLPFVSMGWADEIVELAFAWLVFLGAAALWRNRSHFRVDLLPMKLGKSKAGLRVEIGLACLALGFFLVFTCEGGWVSFKATDRSLFLSFPNISGISSCLSPAQSSLLTPSATSGGSSKGDSEKTRPILSSPFDGEDEGGGEIAVFF